MNIADLKAEVETLKTETAAALTRVAEDVGELKRQLASGTVVQQADLDAIGSGIQTVIDSLKATDPVPEFPAQT